MTLPDLVILACATLGLLISLYFTLVYRKVLRPDAWFVPAFCRLDEATCQFLMNTRNARLLGARNFVLGLFYYLGLIVYVWSDAFSGTIPHEFVMFASFFTVLLGIYLVYGLIAKLKTNCVLCYTSHVINLLILLALLAKR